MNFSCDLCSNAYDINLLALRIDFIGNLMNRRDVRVFLRVVSLKFTLSLRSLLSDLFILDNFYRKIEGDRFYRNPIEITL